VISGTPTTTGTYRFTVQVRQFSDTPRTATREFVIHVGNALQLHGIVLDAVNGVNFSSGIPTEGGIAPLHWSIIEGTLPPGIMFSTETAALPGKPTQTGSFPLTIKVVDSGFPQNSTQHDYVLDVHPPIGLHPTDVAVTIAVSPEALDAGGTLR